MNASSHKFSLEFEILNVELNRLRPDQRAGYLSLHDKLKELVHEAVLDLGDEYVELHRAEAVIASRDAGKQLRAFAHWDLERPVSKLVFNQNHSTAVTYFTLAELIKTAGVLRYHLEGHLQYEIACRIVFDVERPE